MGQGMPSQKSIGANPGDLTDLRKRLFDVHVGMRLKARREMLGLDTHEASQLFGVLAAQLRSFASGQKSLSAAQLHTFARALEVPLSWFYDGAQVDMHIESAKPGAANRLVPSGLKEREQAELIQSYFAMMDGQTRSKLLEIARLLAETCAKPGA